MFRKIGFGAAAALTVGMLAVGCSEDGDTIIQGGSGLTTDNFPGSQVAENNVADDGRAFSNQGQDILFNGFPESDVYWNVVTGEAIGIATARNVQDNNIILYASYFNGRNWTAPVQIRGRDVANGDYENPNSDVNGFKVCWINTAASSVPEVRARDGDAVILFTRNDLSPQPGLTTDEDANRRLWMTYFDRSAASAAAANGVQGGFTVDAVTVDDDNVITGAANDPSVSDFGFVTDSLAGSHEFGAGRDSVDSGQPTTAMNIVYRKDPASGTGVGQRYLAKAILGDAATNDLDSLLDTQETLAPATNALATGENVNGGFTVHNNLMFWNHTTTLNAQAETPATVTQFDEDGVVDEVALGEAIIDNGENDTVGVPDAEDVYGDDHGLASVYVFFTQTGFQTDATPATGEAASDTDLFVGQIDLDATLAVDRVKIDNFSDTIDTGTAGTAAARTGRSINDFGTRINRTAEYITVLFTQENTDATTDTSNPLVNINTNLQLFATVVQTRKPATTGTTPARDIADSVYDDNAGTTTIFEGLRVPAQVASGQVTTLTGIEDDVDDIEFQTELAQGQAVSQSEELLDPACGVQSNAYRMNFIYTQLADGIGNSSTATDEERLLVNGINVDLGDAATDAPVITLVDSTEEVIATRDTGGVIYRQPFNAIATDAGDETRDTAGAPDGDSGRVLVFYLLNGNNPADDSFAGAFVETRLFVWDQGSSELMSTDGVREFAQVTNLLAVVTTPITRTGTHMAGDRIDVIWTENRDNGPGQRLMTRSYDKNAINDGATTNDALENRFTPNLVGGTDPADPVQIDNPTDGSLRQTTFGVDDFVVARSGSTVGVYFTEDEHLYYTDTSTGATGWDSSAGIPAPQLVDNDSPNGQRILAAQIFTPPQCDNLPKSMAFFLRDDPSQQNSQSNNANRFYVRIHN